MTPPENNVSAVERATALVRRIASRESWQSHYGKRWEDEAAEIVAELDTIPAGYVMVPREPTEAMIWAYEDCPYEGAQDKWLAMLSASPVPATEPLEGQS